MFAQDVCVPASLRELDSDALTIAYYPDPIWIGFLFVQFYRQEERLSEDSLSLWLELYYFFSGTSIRLLPPMYIRRGRGILMVPSSLRLFSRNAMSILGGATTVLFNVCAR